jgi:hypothetical protein
MDSAAVDMCPWDGFSPATVHFCENRLCSWISEPANTWSNLGFVAVGVYLLVRASQLHRAPLSLIGITCTLVGIGSFLFHMSGTLFGEMVDVSTMLLISGLMLSLEIRRLVPRMTAVQTAALYVAINGVFELVLLSFPHLGIPLFAFQVLLFIAIHITCRLKKLDADYHFVRWLFWGFGLAFSIWVLDWTGTACDANMHLFNGHAAWHLINAGCMYFYFRYQTQFYVPTMRAVPHGA